MSGSVESLRTYLRACDPFVNDHDAICRCRPVDVRAALDTIAEQQDEIKRLRANNVAYAKIMRKQDAQCRTRTNRIDQLRAEIGRLRAGFRLALWRLDRVQHFTSSPSPAVDAEINKYVSTAAEAAKGKP